MKHLAVHRCAPHVLSQICTFISLFSAPQAKFFLLPSNALTKPERRLGSGKTRSPFPGTLQNFARLVCVRLRLCFAPNYRRPASAARCLSLRILKWGTSFVRIARISCMSLKYSLKLTESFHPLFLAEKITKRKQDKYRTWETKNIF